MNHQIENQEQFDRFAGDVEFFAGSNSLFRAGVSPYYAAMIGGLAGSAREALTRQVVPNAAEISDPKSTLDPLTEKANSNVPEVVHCYPDRVAFCVAMLCPVYCRYCYRKRRDEEEGLHYNRKIIARGVEYIAGNPQIRDVLITGGDPFIASDESIVNLLEQLRAIKHVEIIRFGTRTPVALPYRITEEFCQKLRKYHPLWLNTHFNHPDEITPEAEVALANLVDAGIVVGNQSVLLKGVNDSTEVLLELSRRLIRNRVRPYYIFHCHRVPGTGHLRVPVPRCLEIVKGMRGRISGFGIPTFIVDTPSGKVPLYHQHFIGVDHGDALIEDLEGNIHREIGGGE